MTKPCLVNKQLLKPKPIVVEINDSSSYTLNNVLEYINESVPKIEIKKEWFTASMTINFIFFLVLTLSCLWVYTIYTDRLNEKKTSVDEIEKKDVYINPIYSASGDIGAIYIPP